MWGGGQWMVAQMVMPCFTKPCTTVITCIASVSGTVFHVQEQKSTEQRATTGFQLQSIYFKERESLYSVHITVNECSNEGQTSCAV